MRKTILIACLAFVPPLTGCSTVTDFLFSAFSDGYTGGGSTQAERKSHFDHQREPSAHYSPWND